MAVDLCILLGFLFVGWWVGLLLARWHRLLTRISMAKEGLVCQKYFSQFVLIHL